MILNKPATDSPEKSNKPAAVQKGEIWRAEERKQ